MPGTVRFSCFENLLYQVELFVKPSSSLCRGIPSPCFRTLRSSACLLSLVLFHALQTRHGSVIWLLSSTWPAVCKPRHGSVIWLPSSTWPTFCKPHHGSVICPRLGPLSASPTMGRSSGPSPRPGRRSASPATGGSPGSSPRLASSRIGGLTVLPLQRLRDTSFLPPLSSRFPARLPSPFATFLHISPCVGHMASLLGLARVLQAPPRVGHLAPRLASACEFSHRWPDRPPSPAASRHELLTTAFLALPNMTSFTIPCFFFTSRHVLRPPPSSTPGPATQPHRQESNHGPGEDKPSSATALLCVPPDGVQPTPSLRDIGSFGSSSLACFGPAPLVHRPSRRTWAHGS